MKALSAGVFLCTLVSLFHLSSPQPPMEYDDPANFKERKFIGVCDRPWRPVLRIDGAGKVVGGTINELRRLTLAGHKFRIKIFIPDGNYLLNVDNTNIRGDHVCGESMWHVSDNGTHISTSAEWQYHMLCTNGRVEVVNSPISRPPGWSIDPDASMQMAIADAMLNYGFITRSVESMLWYVKETGSGIPVYSNYLDGSDAFGDKDDLRFMTGIGETRCVMRDRGYCFPLDNTVVNSTTGEVNGQSLWHVAQRFSQDALEIRQPPYLWYCSVTFTGRRDNKRYLVGTTQPRGHNNDFVPMDWFVDECWREVYVNDKYGYQLSGSLDELIFLISLGHRVRVQYGDFILNPSAIRIADRTVIAQNMDEMKRRQTGKYDNFFFNTDSLWKWSIVHTTGKVNTYYYHASNMSYYDEESMKISVRWMVDTRPWKRVFTTPPGPNSAGNPSELIDLINRGASIRFGVQQDVQAGFFFTNADNIRLDPTLGVVYAQALRHISDKKDPYNENEYVIQRVPFYWLLMISSDGYLAMSAWKTETRVQQYDKLSPQVTINWFALV